MKGYLPFLLLLAVAISPLNGRATPAATDLDVIIVGAGIAGLSAALDLANYGAQVAVFDMNSQGSGHAILATGIAMVDTPRQQKSGYRDSPAQAVQDWLAYSEDGNRDWLTFYAEHSRDRVYNWLTKLGVSFDNLVADDTNPDIARFHFPDGHARDIVLPVYRAALKHANIQFHFNTEVTDLLIDRQRVTGVITQNLRSGNQKAYRAKHIILATGGIAGSLDRIRNNWPDHFPNSTRVLAGGSHFAKGLGHDLAVRAGAALDNMDKHWFYAIGIPDPADPNSGLGITLTSPRGIWVNSEGKRFVNPLSSDKVILDTIMRLQPSGFWIIFDDETRKTQRARTIKYRHDQPRYEREVLFNSEIVKRAPNLAELATHAGLPAAGLTATIARYNQLLKQGVDSDLKRFPAEYSGNVTMPAIQPAPIKTPPFYAVKIYPSNAESLGGVRIDFATRVLDKNGNRIPGLYAAGEITGAMGMNGTKYRLNGLHLGPSILTGRMAAATISKTLSVKKNDNLPPQKPDTHPVKPVALNAQALRGLLNEHRPGYWHFDVSHDVILSRKLPCDSCHNKHFPQKTAYTNKQRLSQTVTCAVCH